VKYLSGEGILVIHNEIVEETGGLHGVRDVGLLASAVERPKMRYAGKELYKGVFRKAAVYFDSLARHHVFVDGNKRTAVSVSARFLFLNGYELMVSNKEIVDFTLRVISEKLDTEVVADWLKKNSKKIKK
jgi:death on curing protein